LSLRSTIAYGWFGHLFWDGAFAAYFWQIGRRRFQLPFRKPWLWLAMRRAR
jgi:hypothetical protein